MAGLSGRRRTRRIIRPLASRAPAAPVSPAVSGRMAHPARRRHVARRPERRRRKARPRFARAVSTGARRSPVPSRTDAHPAGRRGKRLRRLRQRRRRMQQTIGEYFAPVQGDVFSSPAVAAALEAVAAQPDGRDRPDLVGADRFCLSAQRRNRPSVRWRSPGSEPRQCRRLRVRLSPAAIAARPGEPSICSSAASTPRVIVTLRCPRGRSQPAPAALKPLSESTPCPKPPKGPTSCTCSRPCRR